MWRWLAVGLTTVVVIAGLWGVLLWWNRPVPPPLGEITLEEVTPPGAELTLRSQTFCSEHTPGFSAGGMSTQSVDETFAWFDDTYGPIHAEASARLNRGGRSHRVYEDVAVFIRPEPSGTFLRVQTYQTTSHYCLSHDLTPWDAENAATYIDACDKLVIEFWGIEYGATRSESPPADWPVLDFDGGRSIAHSIKRPALIYAKPGPDDGWTRYQRDNACGLD